MDLAERNLAILKRDLVLNSPLAQALDLLRGIGQGSSGALRRLPKAEKWSIFGGYPPSPAAGAWEPHEPDYYLQAAAGLWRVRRLHLYFREQCPWLFEAVQPFTPLLEPLIPIAEQKYGLEPLRPSVKPVGLRSQTFSDGSRLVVSSSGILKIDPQSPYLPQDSLTTS